MNDVVLELIQVNEELDYSVIIPIVIGYIALFWLVVSIWIFFDAKRRFEGIKLPILIAIGNMVFMLPFFLVYLLFRPMEEELLLSGHQESNGGVNVPIVNFVGQDGVVMSLELKINNQKMMPHDASEMKIDVNFLSEDDNKKLVEATEAAVLKVESHNNRLIERIKKILAGKVQTKDGLSLKKDDERKKDDTVETAAPVSNDVVVEKNQQKNKKKKKKKR